MSFEYVVREMATILSGEDKLRYKTVAMWDMDYSEKTRSMPSELIPCPGRHYAIFINDIDYVK